MRRRGGERVREREKEGKRKGRGGGGGRGGEGGGGRGGGGGVQCFWVKENASNNETFISPHQCCEPSGSMLQHVCSTAAPIISALEAGITMSS